MEARQLNSFCVLCYQPARVGSHNKANSQTFFQSLSKYLDVHFKLGEEMDKRSDASELVTCADCFEVVGKSFSDLYFQLELLRMQLEWRARVAVDIIKGSERDSSMYNALRGQFTDEEHDDVDHSDCDSKRAVHHDIQMLRGDILRGCENKFKSTFPRVVLERVSEDGKDGNNEISRVVPPPNNHSSIQFVTGFMNFIALCHLSLPFQPPKVSHTDHHHQHSENYVNGEGVSTETIGTNSSTIHINANHRKLVSSASHAEVIDDLNANQETRELSASENSDRTEMDVSNSIGELGGDKKRTARASSIDEITSSFGDEEERIQDVESTSEDDEYEWPSPTFPAVTAIEERMQTGFGDKNVAVASGSNSDSNKDSELSSDAGPTGGTNPVVEELNVGQLEVFNIEEENAVGIEVNTQDNEEFDIGESGGASGQMNPGGTVEFHTEETSQHVRSINCTMNGQGKRNALQNAPSVEPTVSTSKKFNKSTVPNVVEVRDVEEKMKVEHHDKDPVPSHLYRLRKRKNKINIFKLPLNKEQRSSGKVDNDSESTADSVSDERVSAETTGTNSISPPLHAKKRKLVSSATQTEVNYANETRETFATVGVGATTATASLADDDDENNGSTSSSERVVSPPSPPQPFVSKPRSNERVRRQKERKVEVPVTKQRKGTRPKSNVGIGCVREGEMYKMTKYTKLTNGKVKCGCCNRSFAFLSTFRRHVNEKRKGSHHPCDTCRKIFTSSRALRAHKYEIHGAGRNQKFPCPHCGSQFTRARNLKRHLSKNRCKGGLEGGSQ